MSMWRTEKISTFFFIAMYLFETFSYQRNFFLVYLFICNDSFMDGYLHIVRSRVHLHFWTLCRRCQINIIFLMTQQRVRHTQNFLSLTRIINFKCNLAELFKLSLALTRKSTVHIIALHYFTEIRTIAVAGRGILQTKKFYFTLQNPNLFRVDSPIGTMSHKMTLNLFFLSLFSKSQHKRNWKKTISSFFIKIEA